MLQTLVTLSGFGSDNSFSLMTSCSPPGMKIKKVCYCDKINGLKLLDVKGKEVDFVRPPRPRSVLKQFVLPGSPDPAPAVGQGRGKVHRPRQLRPTPGNVLRGDFF